MAVARPADQGGLTDLWAGIRPQIKTALDQAKFIDDKLQAMFAAFDAGEKEKGRDAAWAIYKLKVEKLP